MGQEPPWSPVMPSKAGSCSVLMACLQACVAPVQITAGGLVWADFLFTSDSLRCLVARLVCLPDGGGA